MAPEIPSDPKLLKLQKPMDVLIVGAGLGGLAAALAFKRRNCNVTVLESAPEFKSLGGMMGFAPNGTRLLDRYDSTFKRDMYDSASKADLIGMRDFKGRLIYNESVDTTATTGYRILPGSRSHFHRLFLDHALAAGIKVIYGARAKEFHDEAGKKPSVLTTENKLFEGDLVVAFDGVKSIARDYVLGYPSPPIPSGYSCYRGYAPGEALKKDPLTAPLVDGDIGNFWIGDDCHITAHSYLNGRDWLYVLTRPDSLKMAAEESYSAEGDVKDILELLEGWDPQLVAAVAKTTELLDWRICYRPVLETWVSKNGRLILGGDAAHPFSPTSSQGATQAIEDGAVYACCVAKMPDNLPLALRVAEQLRMPRVTAAQEMGEQQRKDWHQKGGEEKYVKDKMAMKSSAYFNYDAEQDVDDRFDAMVQELKKKGIVGKTL